jgi:outer membrane lipoprotein SlyB
MPTHSILAAAALVLALPLAACNTTDSDDEQTAEAGEQSGEAEAEPSFFQRVFRAEPEPVTVSAGTLVSVRFLDTLSSHGSVVGEAFQAEVIQDIAVDGRTVIPAGSRILGTVTEAQPPKIGGRARLSLDFNTLDIDGRSYPITAAFAQRGRSETPKDAAIIGGGTLGGAILGEAVDEGEGTVVGAVVGGIAGALGAKKTKGKPVVVSAGSTMSLQLASPVTVEVS